MPVIVPRLVIIVMSAIAVAQSDGGATLGVNLRASEQTPPPLFTDDDLRFLRHMSVHHEQAIVMSLMVPARTDRDELMRFARYLRRAQAAEIELMQSLLELAAARGVEMPDDRPRGDPPMVGMLSTAQMDALAATHGAAFERLWLEGMVYHHQGAIDMAHTQQRQQLEHGRRPYGIGVLVEDILVEQRAEIAKMRAWLGEWERAPG